MPFGAAESRAPAVLPPFHRGILTSRAAAGGAACAPPAAVLALAAEGAAPPGTTPSAAAGWIRVEACLGFGITGGAELHDSIFDFHRNARKGAVNFCK